MRLAATLIAILGLSLAACGGTGDGDTGPGDPPAPRCGDGKLNAGEACDLGDDLNSDTEPDRCRTDCSFPRCGDGVADEGEECDDGNGADTDACTSACELARCGDGFVGPGEECDDALANSDSEPDACRTSCVAPSCGDEVVDSTEDCDDGNSIDGDLCTNACRSAECGDGILFAAREACDEGAANSDLLPDTCRTDCSLPSCGDGVRDAGESCDDGNDDETDGCVGTCEAARCGDGLLWEGEEECDEGVSNDDFLRDACRTDCRRHSCGDGVNDSDEQCDDGNDVDTDICVAGCKRASCGDGFLRQGVEECDLGSQNANQPGAGCRLNCKLPACHDGVKDGEEECDDGNRSDDDGCVADCRNAFCGDAFVRTGTEECDQGAQNADEPDRCRLACVLPFCGDLIVDSDEECEDGNEVDTDACVSCKDAFCGDGIIWADNGEVCDDGAENKDEADACRTTCVPPRCGDAIVDSEEGCDDGDDLNADDVPDACRTTCVAAACGDGVVDSGESCDLGADNGESDACRRDCTYCGDGVIDAGESCDDRNAADGDGCSSECRVEVDFPLLGTEAVIKGDLDGTEFTFERPGEGNIDLHIPLGCAEDPGDANGAYETYYDVYQLKNDTGEDQVLVVEAIWDDWVGADGDDENDGYILLYSGSFDPGNPLVGCGSASDDYDYNGADAKSRRGSSRTGAVTVKAGESAYVIPTSWNHFDDANGGGLIGAYTLHVENAGITVTDTESNDSDAEAQAITDSVGYVRGGINPAADEDWYSFAAVGGETYRIEIMSDRGYCRDRVGYESYLEIYDTDGSTLIDSSSDHWYFDYDGVLSTKLIGCVGLMWTPDANGTYYFRVTEENGDLADPYYLTVRDL